ncbi:MAG: hypothetical protein MUP22_14600, partial [Desulfobacterales bacterium]|nr:hypothetical protein [Desulfobacterales bacterium]
MLFECKNITFLYPGSDDPRGGISQQFYSAEFAYKLHEKLEGFVFSDAGYLTFQTGKLWNVTAPEAGFTDGMTMKEGRHGGSGLAIGRETMRPILDFIGKAQSAKKP